MIALSVILKLNSDVKFCAPVVVLSYLILIDFHYVPF